MAKLVTIKTFTYVNDTAIVKSILDAEGIYYFVKDELTAQMHPFYSNAIAGIKLQVREEDVDKAISILKETGYLEDKDFEPSSLEVRLYKFFSKIPLLKKIYKNE